MGIKLFSDSTPSINPDPYRYKILRSYYDGHLLLVNYPDCTSFGGNKLLLLKEPHKDGPLDPHLLSESHVVLARFTPNKLGRTLARAALKAYLDIYGD